MQTWNEAKTNFLSLQISFKEAAEDVTDILAFISLAAEEKQNDAEVPNP